jgi:hypothetical protein
MVVEMFEKDNNICVEIIKKAPFFANYTSKFVNDIIGSLVLSNLFSISNMSLVLNTDTVNTNTNLILDNINTIEKYKNLWEKINNVDLFSKKIIYLKYDYEFNKIRSNKHISELMCCSEENVRKNLVKTIIKITKN